MLLLERVPENNVCIFTHSDSLSLSLFSLHCLFVRIITLRKDKANTHGCWNETLIIVICTLSMSTHDHGQEGSYTFFTIFMSKFYLSLQPPT